MATEKVFNQLICKCERCDPPKVWTPKNNKMPKTCAGCRSELWNKPKPKPRVLTEGDLPTKALQCAIVYNFDCEYFRQKIPASALCKTCFTLPVWNDKAKIAGIIEAFSPQEESDEPDLALEPLKAEVEVPARGEKVIEAKSAEEIMAAMEKREVKEPEFDMLREDGELPPVTGGEKLEKTKEKQKLQYTANARTCSTKYMGTDGKWTCNFFTHKTESPPFPYCKLCWELEAVWQERAIGQK